MDPKDKAVKEEAEQEAAPDPEAAFLAFLSADDTPVPVEGVEGCMIRAIPDAEYQEVRAFEQRAAYDAKGSPEERMAAKVNAKRAALLAHGVVTPKKTVKEWLFLLSKAQAGKVDVILDAIKERSGIEDEEALLTKKALALMQDTMQNLTSV